MIRIWRQGDRRQILEAVHKLKGIAGNLALADLYGKMCTFEARLREGEATSKDFAPMILCLKGTVQYLIGFDIQESHTQYTAKSSYTGHE